MTHTYKVTGMTCSHCVKRVQKALSEVKCVENVTVTLDPPKAEINMIQLVETNTFNTALDNVGDYRLEDED